MCYDCPDVDWYGEQKISGQENIDQRKNGHESSEHERIFEI